MPLMRGLQFLMTFKWQELELEEPGDLEADMDHTDTLHRSAREPRWQDGGKVQEMRVILYLLIKINQR